MDIIIGRTQDEIEKYGKEGTIFIGKEYIKMENALSLANEVYLDVNFPHIILIVGKRGQGKSYTLSSIIEGISLLDYSYRKNIVNLVFDTMGIFWTMKFPNYREAELLERWNMKPKALDNAKIYVPEGIYEKYEDLKIPVDDTFTINPHDLSEIDWTLVFNLNPISLKAAYLQRIIRELKRRNEDYSIENIINYIEKKSLDPKIKEILINYFENANSWGLFSEKATQLKKILTPGDVIILDISLYTTILGGWSVKNLVIGLISKKIFYERLLWRKKEELEEAYLGFEIRDREMPLIWIYIDEAHEAIPKDSITPATEPLLQIIREGRQPGISLVLATQQPGKLLIDAISQSDIVISHRVTAKSDIDALNEVMKNFTAQDIEIYMNENLPKRKGAAIVLDDKSERIYPVQIKPRFSWHGGQDAQLIRKRIWLEEYSKK
ncbi:MAG: ATP-binding protein [Nanopusillaceae archaeon]